MQNVFLSDYNFVSNEGNLIIFFLRLKDIAEWNKIIVKKNQKMKKNRVKNGSENLQLFISRKFYYIQTSNTHQNSKIKLTQKLDTSGMISGSCNLYTINSRKKWFSLVNYTLL